MSEPQPSKTPQQQPKKKQNQQNQQNQKQKQNQGQKGEQKQNQKNQKQNQNQKNQKQQPPAEAKPAQQKPEEPISEIASLFSHIPQVRKWTTQELLNEVPPAKRNEVHPALLEYILTTSLDVSLDENERCRNFLKMMRQMIHDEPIDSHERFSQSISKLIKLTVTLINKTRMATPGVGNAIRFLKVQMPLDGGHHDDNAFRQALIAAIDNFIADKINDVSDFLSRTVAASIADGDVILTYAYSPIIANALKEAATTKSFRVVVVDSRPNFESRRLIEEIPMLDVRYVLISGLSYVMPEVTKVLIEPCGILSNNAALTPVGTAMISMVAHEFGIPVVFVCGSYRFVGDVRVDALAKNEMLSREFVAPVPRSGIAYDPEYLALIYDVTPGQYVDVVVSELGNIPVNSISTNMKYIQDSYTFFSKTTQALKK